MAIEFVVQRLQIGDFVLIDLPGQGGQVEAKVLKVDRAERTMRVTLHVEGHEDFVKEWHLGETVIVVRGP